MPLPGAVARRDVHRRTIDMNVFAREDGFYDVEAHLVDRKAYPFTPYSSTEALPAGERLHDLRIRVTVDDQYVVRDIRAASDVTPYAVCKGAEATLAVLIGERIASGWSRRVKAALRGAASCNHLMEMLIPLATTAWQGIQSLHRDRLPATNENGLPRKLDTCYAYARNGEIAKRLWPQYYQPVDGQQSGS